MTAIAPCLWFDSQAEEAADFYVSLLGNSRITDVSWYGEGGPQFLFTEAMSLAVSTPSQEETDRLWTALSADGGEESMCGWLKDKYGLSWQIVPTRLGELLSGADAEGAGRAMQAMLTMRKIDIAGLERAYNG